MFKFSAACVLVAFLCLGDVQCLSDEMLEMAKMLHETCQTETGVTDALIEAARKGDFQEDNTLKCYMKCLMAQLATIDDDGIIDVEAVIAVMPEELKSFVEGGIRKCGTKIGKDPCDNAFLTHKCYYETSPEHYFLI